MRRPPNCSSRLSVGGVLQRCRWPLTTGTNSNQSNKSKPRIIMRKIIQLFTFIFGILAICFSTVAQVYQYIPICNGDTNGVAAASTRTLNTVIDVRKQRTFALLTSFACGGTNAQPTVLTIHRSIDGSNWDTTSVITWSVTSNGTNTVVCGTNFTCNGYGFFRLTSIATTNATIGLTNIILGYAVKQAD